MRFRLFSSLLSLLLTVTVIHGQTVLDFGLSIGPTANKVNAIVTVDGEKTANHDFSGTGLYGFHAGVFTSLSFSESWSLKGELGYELIRFRPLGEPIFGNGHVHHVRFAGLINYRPLHIFGFVGGVELVRRDSRVTDSVFLSRLNGSTVKGLYWQGTLGVILFPPHDKLMGWSIDARATFPKIASVSQLTDGVPSDNRLIEEQLRSFKLSLNIPLTR